MNKGQQNKDAALTQTGQSPLAMWKGELFREGNLSNFAKVLSGTGLTPERFAMQAYLATQRTPGLLAAPRMKLWMGVFAAAECGLSMQPHLQQYHLVPFGKEITPIIGYQGYTFLTSKASGGLIEKPTIVWQRDIEERRFKYRQGAKRTAELDPIVRDPKKPRGELRYVIATYINAAAVRTFHVMEREEFLERRERSAGWLAFRSGKRKSSPWEIKLQPDGSDGGDWPAMCAKTVIRDFAKVLPKSADHWGERAAKAEAVEGAVEHGNDDAEDLRSVLDTVMGAEVERTGTDRLKEQLGVEDATFSEGEDYRPPEPPEDMPLPGGKGRR